MPKRTRPEPKPTPVERPQPSPVAVSSDPQGKDPSDQPTGDVLVPPFNGSGDVCRICGTARTADVCAVDGFRFNGDA